MGNEKELSIRLGKIRIESPDDAMVAIYKEKSPVERIKIASEMRESARLLISAVLRSQHPGWSEEKINKEVIKRLSSRK